jgi:putative transferase (TIGR04331 family)
MPATLLAGGKFRSPRNASAEVLYVATAESRYTIWLQNLTEHGTRYIDSQRRFWNNLGAESRAALRLRLYAEDYGWDMAERWKEIAPDARFESTERPFMESLEDCGLYVCDHLGTTFYQAMATNKPTIAFFDPSMNPMRREGQFYFDALRSAGILYDHPEAAAEAVNSVYRHAQEWWNDSSRQRAREDLCRRFARTSPHAMREWTAELTKLISHRG